MLGEIAEWQMPNRASLLQKRALLIIPAAIFLQTQFTNLKHSRWNEEFSSKIHREYKKTAVNVAMLIPVQMHNC